MTEGQIKMIGHLTFVFVVVLLIGTIVITTRKTRESFTSADVTKYSVTLFYQEGCGHCYDMLAPTGPVGQVATAVTNFLSNRGDGKNCNIAVDFSNAVPSSDKAKGPVNVNDTKNQALVQMLGVTYTPFLVLTDATGRKISEFTGPKSCQGIATWLNTAIPCIPQTVCPYSTS